MILHCTREDVRNGYIYSPGNTVDVSRIVAESEFMPSGNWTTAKDDTEPMPGEPLPQRKQKHRRHR